MSKLHTKRIKKLLISVAIPLAIWFFGSYFTMTQIDTWYLTLNKPFFNPPNWIFWPVWTLLYILIGISFYLVWREKFGKKKKRQKVLWVYSIQLFLNFTWSMMFFYFQSPFLWLINILILWYFILWNIFLFHKIKPLSGYLLVPYLLWVTFATLLNFSIYILN